ncbi:MAG: 50S ribosomal protein L11 methyltransferase [Anaerolineales bacterium]
MHWLEISLTVDGELAEAVAEVLSRFIPDGVVIESTQILNSPDTEGEITGPLRVYGYLPADDSLEDTRQRLTEALWYLGRISPLPEPQFRDIQEVNWVETWKQHYNPIPVGNRLVILPAWIETNPYPNRLPLRINPGMAFGTGTHPTTQLTLALLEDYVQPHQPVIDVGCGSGILSAAALILGAGRALGVDIDSEAPAASRENAALNGVENLLETGVGSVSEILANSWGIRQAPLVLANILAPILIRLLDDGLADLLTPDGVLLLSGILEPQMDGTEGYVSMAAALEKHHLHILERRQLADWVALAVKKKG